MCVRSAGMKRSGWLLAVACCAGWLGWGAGWVRADDVILPVVNREYLPTVVKLIAGATNTIEFIQLEYRDGAAVRRIEEELVRAVRRGVRVRGLLDDGVSFNADCLERLRGQGLDVKLDTPEKMTHCKIIMVDGRVVLLGSTNWTGNSMGNNNETNLRLVDGMVAGYFREYFEAVWADSAAEPELPAVESGAVKTVVNRQYFPEVMELLEGARERVRVIMYGVSYSPKYAGGAVNQLVEALVGAHERGVDVAMVMDLSHYNHLLNRVNRPAKEYLARAGVKVFEDPLMTTTHAKLVLVDDAVVIGSVNWGKDAMEKRNETSVLVRDAAIADYFFECFARPSVSAEAFQLEATG